ncbi:hypothetical protein T231_01820, partial [Tannerella sp. oral taxon BU063 isolate Cell 6/7/9]
EFFQDLVYRLKHSRTVRVVFIDSVQFMDLKYSEYRRLRLDFPRTLFVFISHVKNNRGTSPDGSVATKIMRDSDVIFSVRGFKAFVTSRFGGNGEFVISEEMAAKFYLE